MVQKKVASNLDLQPHHVATQDLKSIKPPDLKTKKMKKSGSFKHHLKPKPVPAVEPPNYMKSTTSFDARKEEVSPKRPTTNTKLASANNHNNNNKPSKATSPKKAKNPSFKPPRATCSSTLKHAKFPDYLSLHSGGTELEGTSIVKVCPYTYCSLNGHHQSPLPPLKQFLSARRQAIKLSAGCLSPRRVKKGIIGNEPIIKRKEEETKEGFLGEELQVESMGMDAGFDKQEYSEPSDMEWEIEGRRLDFEYEYECSPKTDIRIDLDDKKDGCCFDDYSVSQESFEDEGFTSDALSSIIDDDGEFTNIAAVEVPLEEPNEEKAKNEAKTESEDSSSSLMLVITKGKDLTEDMDEYGQYNQRAPNLLPLEVDPEAEKVDLKHQDLDERKNAEEWMVDYALRQVVTKLGPARKRKVALLVEAFEKLKKCDINSKRGSGFDQARPMQTCF